MRARDARAILFCVVSTLALMALSFALLRNYLATLALAGAYLAWLLTRPRMQRVIRRLQGAPDWSGYYQDELAMRAPPPQAPPASPPPRRPRGEAQ